MTLVGAAAAADMPLDAAELAYRYIDAAYRSTDRRELDGQGGLPGVTREYHSGVALGKWGQVDYVNAGIEGYGWGALSIHLMLRYLLGLQEEEPWSISIRPALPQALRRAGATYGVAALPWGKYVLTSECAVKDERRYLLDLRCATTITGLEQAGVDEGAQRQVRQEYRTAWDGAWGEGQTLQLPHLTTFSAPPPR
jgi:hypothetical protein